MNFAKKSVATLSAVALLSVAGVAAANTEIRIEGSGDAQGEARCPGGMTRLGHPFDAGMSIFPGDPAVHVRDLYTVAVDYFNVEDIDLGAHAGTHIDVPAHFIDGRVAASTRCRRRVRVARLQDRRRRIVTSTRSGLRRAGRIIEAYEIRQTAESQAGALVDPANRCRGVLRARRRRRRVRHGVVQGSRRRSEKFVLSANTDDLFEFENAGFSGAAVQWLFDDDATIDGGRLADAYGPDAYSDGYCSTRRTRRCSTTASHWSASANLDCGQQCRATSSWRRRWQPHERLRLSASIRSPATPRRGRPELMT